MCRKLFYWIFNFKWHTVSFFIVFLCGSLTVSLGSSAREEEYGVRWKVSFANKFGINLDAIHREMALIEKEVTDKLQAKDKTKNIALSRITILYKEKGAEKGKIFTYELPKKSVFTSGTKLVELADRSSSIIVLPPTREDRLIAIITERFKAISALKAGERDFLSHSILEDYEKRSKYIAAGPMVEKTYSECRAALAKHKGLSFNKKGLGAVPTTAELSQETEKVGNIIAQLKDYSFEHQGALESVDKELGIIKKQIEDLATLKRQGDDINQALKGCADAEQHMLAYLTKDLVELEGLPTNAEVDHIILHIHSRFDMCQFCAPSFWIELKRPDGFLQDLRKAYTRSGKEPTVTILVSSREELKGSGRRASGRDKNEVDLIDFSQPPLFVYQKVEKAE